MESIIASFSTSVKLKPLIIMSLTAIIYQRAGTRSDNTCSSRGIFSMGYIIPESSVAGSIIPIPEINKAINCELVTVEINKPIDNATKINKTEIIIKLKRLPTIGTFKTKTESKMTVPKLTKESNR